MATGYARVRSRLREGCTISRSGCSFPTRALRAFFFLAAGLLQTLSATAQQPQAVAERPGQSGCLAFVDREFIFTLEFVSPGVPLFNFVSLVEEEHNLLARDIRLTFETRKIPGKYFLVDTADPKEPVIVPSVRMKPKSSFGVRLQGEFGEIGEIPGATVQVGNEDFRLVPLTSFEFENLAMKVNRLNLGSPDLRDDWRVLKLEMLGTREPLRRRPRR